MDSLSSSAIVFYFSVRKTDGLFNFEHTHTHTTYEPHRNPPDANAHHHLTRPYYVHRIQASGCGALAGRSRHARTHGAMPHTFDKRVRNSFYTNYILISGVCVCVCVCVERVHQSRRSCKMQNVLNVPAAENPGITHPPPKGAEEPKHANTTTHTDTILSPTVSRSHLLLRRRRARLQNDICKYVGNKKMRTFRALQDTGFNVITYHAFVCTHTNRIRMQWFCDFIVSSPHLVSPDGRRSWHQSAEHTQTRQYLHTDATRRTKEAKKG